MWHDRLRDADCQSIAASVTVTIDTTRPLIQPATSVAIRIALRAVPIPTIPAVATTRARTDSKVLRPRCSAKNPPLSFESSVIPPRGPPRPFSRGTASSAQEPPDHRPPDARRLNEGQIAPRAPGAIRHHKRRGFRFDAAARSSLMTSTYCSCREDPQYAQATSRPTVLDTKGFNVDLQACASQQPPA